MTRGTIVMSVMVLGALGTTIGCGGKDQSSSGSTTATAESTGKAKPSGSGSAAAAAMPSGSAAPAADSGPKGLAAKDNDEKILKMAKSAMTCSWESSGFAYSCAEYKAWSNDYDTFKDGAGDKTLVNFLEDPDEKVRWLGASKLRSTGITYKTDKALAERVVGAAEKEKSTNLASPLGDAISAIYFDKTGTWDRVAAMIKKHDLGEFRRSIVSNMLSNNKDNEAAVQLAMDMVKDSDKEMRYNAISAFSNYSGAKSAEACKFLIENADNADDYVAAHAAATAGYNSACGDVEKTLLDSLEKRIKAQNTNENSTWGYSLYEICANSKASDDDKKRTVGLAKTLAGAETKGDSVRTNALDAVLKCDPAGGKTFVGTFTSDKSDWVRRHAKDKLAEKN